MVESGHTSTNLLETEGAELTTREASNPLTTTKTSTSTEEQLDSTAVNSTSTSPSNAGMGTQATDSQLRSRDQRSIRERSSSSREGSEPTARSTMAGRKEGISVALLSLPDDDGGEDWERRRRRTARRNDVAFWLLGLINNSIYVIMMAVAKEIAPGAVGLVFLADVAPTMVVKITAPYWFHLVPYSVRVWACTVLMVLSLVTVGYGGSTSVQLVGVCFSALQGGLGEASFLALSAFYDTPRALTAWSSGTGFAGIFGYAWVFFLKYVLGFSFRATLMMANLITLCWLYAYFRLLSDPSVSSGGGGSSRGVVTSSCDQAHDGVYSPLNLQQLAPTVSLNGNEPRHTSSVDERERGDWGGSFGAPPSPDASLRVDGEVAETRAAQMTMGQRLRFTLSLWRFTVPLMLVYFAEYTMQTGTWSAIGFPVTSESARQKFYQYANWSYQGGVFLSRSSGMIIRLSPLALWSLPAVQVAMLFFFYLVAVERFWYDYSLLFLCFGVGLVGGLGYVNAFRLVAEAVRPELKELALASASVGDSLGVMFSDIFGTFVQACVYKRNGIDGAWATC